MAETIYLAGPMAGYENLNEQVFRLAARWLESLGHWVIVPHDLEPHEHEGDCPPGYRSSPDSAHSAACHLRAGLLALLKVNSVMMLPRWESSVGARLELAVATSCGIPVRFAEHEITNAWAEASEVVNAAYEALALGPQEGVIPLDPRHLPRGTSIQ